MGPSSKPSANPAWLSVLQMEHEHVPSGILIIRSVTLHLAGQEVQGEYLEAAGNLLDWVILFLVDWWPFVRNSLHHSLHNIYNIYVYIPAFNSSTILLNHLSPCLFPLLFSSVPSVQGMSKALRSNSRPLSRGQQTPVRPNHWGAIRGSYRVVMTCLEKLGIAGEKNCLVTFLTKWESQDKIIFGHGYFQMLMAAKWFDPKWPDLPVLVDSYDFRSP